MFVFFMRWIIVSFRVVLRGLKIARDGFKGFEVVVVIVIIL